MEKGRDEATQRPNGGDTHVLGVLVVLIFLLVAGRGHVALVSVAPSLSARAAPSGVSK